ncbi:Ribosomal RNA small subunit methyltransferase NEP1 (18S rRNA (pseudouridine(1248)-N1)-methyltransferase) (18S rRNA Psi1248 methyltransferase) (Nucleolar protein EMG1 homolog) (Protein C2f) (Ribosome biogenesis protein NEP1) [Durusdinium trenchii]|uniref:Uncharacterized protein n=1 Tax=Durusdinium trenchii TaxID=1381693 RepID=A0ABP0MPD4_9DINO
MGPQRSGAIVLEVTCVPVQRSNGDLSIPRDGLVNDSSAPQDGTEIRLAQQLGGTLRSPEWGLSEQNGKVVIQKVGLRRWILTDDGLLILENRPEFALSVAGPIDAGAQLGLQFHYFTPDHKNSWQMDPSGRISLRHTPSFSLAVYNGALHGGAEVVLWNDPLSMPHNTWTRQAPTSGSLSSTDACKLRVLGSRCGRDSGSWFSGPKDYQKGYVAVSQSPDRDAATESSWAKVVDHSHSSEIAHFIKEPKMGSAFLLKLMDPTGKTVQGYLSCEEVGKDDKRIPDGVFAYVVKDPAGASMFEEEMSSEGLVLSHVGGGGHLCCGKFNEKDYVTGCTWLYVLKGQPEWAAAFAPQSTYVPAAGKKESCWKSFWKLYCLKWIPQWYRRWILLGCFLLGLFVIFWTIVWFVRLFQAPPEPLQINVPYDCDHQPEHMWSHTKKAWCCEHWDQGCPTTTVKPTPAAPKFPMAPGAAPTAPGVGGPPGGPVVSRAQSSDEDCFTDVLNWQRDWTISKQNFCCEKHGIACRAALTTAAFDCDEDYHKWTELWSYRKKLYCCLHHERGCPAKGEAEMGSSESFDCAAGYGDWEAWEQKKKEWCCSWARSIPRTVLDDGMIAMPEFKIGKWGGPTARWTIAAKPVGGLVVDVASIAAHALAQAATEEALEKSLSPQEVLAQASASAASVEHLDLMEAEVIARQEVEKRLGDAPNTTLDGGAMKEVLTAQGLSSSLLQRLAVPAQHYITSLPVIGGFAQNPALCTDLLHKSQIPKILRVMEGDDPTAALALAISNASAHFRDHAAGMWDAVGRDAECAARALRARKAEAPRDQIHEAHLAYLCAQAAASAVADRVALLGGTADEIGRQRKAPVHRRTWSHRWRCLADPEATSAVRKRAIMKGASEMGDLARCARAAAEGAIGKGAQTALQGQIEEAADLVAFQAAKAAVTEGLLPFQVTERAEKAAAALRLSSPGGHESDGLVAARAILEHGLWVSAEHENTARLARVAAEAGGLRIEEARHQVAQQLSKLVANHKAELMSLDPASSRHVAAKARESARAAGCKEAEVAWVASHAASAACATTAAARGASSEVIAQVALAAARASGVPDMEARQISAWSAAKSASEQALSFGDSVAHAGQAAQRAAHASGLEGETAHRLAGEAAAQVVLAEARDGGDTYSHIAQKCKAAAQAAGMENAGASVLAASLACPKAAEAAAILQRSPAEIGHAARAAAQAAGALDQKGSEEAAVAAASAVVQSALSDSTSQGLAPAEVARKAQEAWASAGATGRVVAPCIAATAVLKRLERQRHSVPEHLTDAAKAIAAESPAARQQLASILAKAVAESSARRGGRADEVASNVLKSLRESDTELSDDEVKELAAAVTANEMAKVAVQEGLRPPQVSAAATQAAEAVGLPKAEVQDVACVAAAAALAKHSKHVRQEAEEVGSLVLQATRAAGCEDQKGLAAAITAASRSAAKASLALHGTSPASVAEAAWSAARKVLAHVGRSSSKRIWAHLVSIEAVSAWQAQGLVAGLDAHAAEGKARIQHALRGVSKEETKTWFPLSLVLMAALTCFAVLLCLLSLWTKNTTTKVFNAQEESRTLQKFCCATEDDEVYSALTQDLQTLEDDLIRHNRAAHPWFDSEDRFGPPQKLVVVLERAGLERSRELVGPRAKAPRPDHELQITFDALEMLLESELNQAGRLVVYMHSASDVLVEVHPGFCMPSSLQGFAKNVWSVLRKRRWPPEAPVLRVVDGPCQELLPPESVWYALSPQGESVQLKELARDVAGRSLPPGSSCEPVAPDRELPPVVFSVGASFGDATKDPHFRAGAARVSICPWDLTSAACCRMLCNEFESLWDVRRAY